MGCVGLIIAVRTRSVQVTVNSWLLFMPLAFLTSAFMPRDLLTGWFQFAVGLNPVEYILVAVRTIIIDGWVWEHIVPGFWVLLATSAVLIAAATYEYRRATESTKSLESYRTQPNLVAEHANAEEDTARGGYANRQLFELVQNSADALSESAGERILISLTSTHLYCADNGQPINRHGLRALLFSHLSAKRNTAEIGRFGLGFKSVLGVTDTPEFFSKAGSFRFDRHRSAELLRPIAPRLERYPRSAPS